MHVETFDILRCPFCGGRLELVQSMYHRGSDTEISDGVLGCQCCLFPVVDGIPVMHLQPNANAARGHIEDGRPELALRSMVGIEGEAEAERFESAARSTTSTYREIVEALGPGFEGGYFLYRFSDPTFIVAQAVVRAVAGAVLHGSRRAIDVCGGSGHLTRSLLDLSSPAPVLADLYFPKIWLARRFTAPGCEPVCCDGNGAFPFARGTFAYAMCSDAFMFIWTKRQFVSEMARLVDVAGEPGAVVITHTHNQLAWSPSHGQPLSPAGYRNLFETRRGARVRRGGPLPGCGGRRPAGPVPDRRRAHTERRPGTDARRDPARRGVPPPRHRAAVHAPRRLPDQSAVRGIHRRRPPAAPAPLSRRRLRGRVRRVPGSTCRRTPASRGPRSRASRPAAPLDELAELIRRRVIVDLPRQYY